MTIDLSREEIGLLGTAGAFVLLQHKKLGNDLLEEKDARLLAETVAKLHEANNEAIQTPDTEPK